MFVKVVNFWLSVNLYPYRRSLKNITGCTRNNRPVSLWPAAVHCSINQCLTLQIALGIIVPYRIIWSWYTGRWWVGCYVWYSDEGPGRARAPPRPLIAVPNVTAHPSTASVPNTVLLYNSPLLCGFSVPIKGLISLAVRHVPDKGGCGFSADVQI